MATERAVAGLAPEHGMLREAFGGLLRDAMPSSRLDEAAEEGWLRDVWVAVASGGWLEIAADSPGSDPDDSLSILDLTLLAEEAGARLLPGPFALTTAFVVPLLARAASPWLPTITSGDRLITALVPPPIALRPTLSFNWRAVAVASSGDALGDGFYPNVPFAGDADAILVPSTFGDEVRVAVVPTNRAGVEITPLTSIDGTTPTANVALSSVPVVIDDWLPIPADALSEELDRGMAAYVSALNGEAVGAMSEMLARTVEYVTERWQFGVPIGSFQAVKHRLADAFLQLELARLLTRQAARAPFDESGAVDLACARVRSADAYIAVCEAAIQLHGGLGVSWEQGLHFWYRRALLGRTQPAPLSAFRAVIGDHLRSNRDAAVGSHRRNGTEEA